MEFLFIVLKAFLKSMNGYKEMQYGVIFFDRPDHKEEYHKHMRKSWALHEKTHKISKVHTILCRHLNVLMWPFSYLYLLALYELIVFIGIP